MNYKRFSLTKVAFIIKHFRNSTSGPNNGLKIINKNVLSYRFSRNSRIKSITSERLRDLISNANDDLRHQLRVDWSGDVYISTTTGSEDIEDVKFRWESWDSGNGYAGPFAASNHAYIEQMLQDLKLCWEKNLRGYVDYW